MKNIAIFASGSGSNAEKIFEYSKLNNAYKVSLLLSNKKDAFVIQRANNHNIPVILFNRDTLYNTNDLLVILSEFKIDLIVLAGFLWLMPKYLINAFPNKIVNIHPALLPKYGGKGMYGMKVHEEVILNKEMQSGITIHYVNEKYDDGAIIFQKSCKVERNDTPETLAQKIH
ncbi:MAG: phosphoribosylglycinamide formyltransferase, partial [Bacteroidales bacterium]|nr:phosphoribosylglycinamide formyltransferase [Bacteroidales bacterium]